jgi:uncharacterized protein with PhoU and TrkA domain
MSTNPADKSSDESRLKGRDVKKLDKSTQRIEVKRGNAWISLENEDILLEPGESVTIRSSEHGGVISASGKDTMVFRTTDLKSELEAAKDADIRLKGKDAQSLKNTTQMIEIKRGNAWISLENEDILLEPGESVTIRSSQHGGVISASGKDTMEFRISDLNLDDREA